MAGTDGRILERAAFAPPAWCFREDGHGLKEACAHLAEVEAERIAYASDGLSVQGFLVRPKGPGPWPCVICNRGGNRDFAAIDPAAVVDLLCRIASWGYVVAASQYRGWGESGGRDEFGGADLDDVMNLFPLLEAEPAADTARIGMYGGSRGGMMTLLALARTDRVRAAVLRCGVTDLTGWRQERGDMEAVFKELIPGYDPADDTPLRARSAVNWAGRLCRSTPILLMQGNADWRVNPVSALRFAERLLAADHPFRLVMLEGADHALSGHIPERNRLTRDWFDRFVRDREPVPRGMD